MKRIPLSNIVASLNISIVIKSFCKIINANETNRWNVLFFVLQLTHELFDRIAPSSRFFSLFTVSRSSYIEMKEKSVTQIFITTWHKPIHFEWISTYDIIVMNFHSTFHARDIQFSDRLQPTQSTKGIKSIEYMYQLPSTCACLHSVIRNIVILHRALVLLILHYHYKYNINRSPPNM